MVTARKPSTPALTDVALPQAFTYTFLVMDGNTIDNTSNLELRAQFLWSYQSFLFDLKEGEHTGKQQLSWDCFDNI